MLPYNYGDANGAWTDPDGTNGYNMRAGVTTFFGMRKTYDYFKLNHNRLSYNNSNGTVDAYSEILGGLWNTVDNAKWDPIYNAMFFGAGATGAATDDINSIDIVGHEFTHGVVQYSAGLVYQGESGALNESFADIFGECIEFLFTWHDGLD
ncbi:MAG: M4 family metallopeptidase [Bacteroidetes bacterium]|nr:M4 family metallopeptidase [Bacteroidota bacterium]